MKKILIGIILIQSIIGLSAYSVLETFDGNYIGNINPRTAAMGNTGVAKGENIFDLNLNPANAAFLKTKVGAQIVLNVTKDNDDRSFPMYNFFDGFVDDATYVSNTNFFNDISFGTYYKQNFDKLGFTFGFLYNPVINFAAAYNEQVRNDESSAYDNYPPIIAKNLIDVTGAINSLGFDFAFDYAEKLAIGLKLDVLNGDQDYEEQIFWTDQAKALADNPADLHDHYLSFNRDFKGFCLNFGTIYKLNERIELGLSFVPKVEYDVSGDLKVRSDTLDTEGIWQEHYDNYNISDAVLYYGGEYDTAGVFIPQDSVYFDTYKTPSRIRGGISYQPQNIMLTTFNLDVEYVTWNDVNPFYNNEFNYYIGIEHKLNNKLPFRFGFKYETNYYLTNRTDDNGVVVFFANKITLPTFTLGTGFTFLEKFRFDISGEIGHRKYEMIDLFPDSYYNHAGLYSNMTPSDRGWGNPDTVNETFTKIKAGISFDW